MFQKIVHRDLAMRNILVDTCLHDYFHTYKFYNAKLADFGLAKEYNHNESTRILKGYCEPLSTSSLLPWPIMAPEVLLAFTQSMPEKDKSRLFTVATDMWSFGMLSAEFLNLKEGSCRIADSAKGLVAVFSADRKVRKV